VPRPEPSALCRARLAYRGWHRAARAAPQPDHIHLVVRVWPSDGAAEVGKQYQSVTAVARRQEFPVVLKLPARWTSSSCFRRHGSDARPETMRRALEAHAGGSLEAVRKADQEERQPTPRQARQLARVSWRGGER